ncbi:MAG: hypothetical protein NW220_16755 [Leptolyngbyaceae cyanobacterium bins.349]|nr:hypothetical protein [Leptolyngbyaceae cyanobacterium bins.349]
MATHTFTVVVHREEDMYLAECLEVGTVDQGATIEQAVANVKEATRLYLEESSLPEDVKAAQAAGKPIPSPQYRPVIYQVS